VQAWLLALQEQSEKTYLKNWWCSTEKKSVKSRENCCGIGSDYHILVWNLEK
jgi:hypothetical protein